ncbi:sensor histidine kinase [Pedosphaera parvula]|uniref:histidine kinase n=1 Tax=Pedosphaera parvula (strain Ellin514) TaxID=320771 RepID=B9XFJ0_PEDPL|nr:HAMP domain-containing sensor histidine kinase [Pedosphaera parvula]EEF61354.1 integral membrane sensor signal transduction histidine kinase [Pedosphaera parvula Ellin514]
MIRFIRRLFSRTGQNSELWPVVLLLFAVVVPAVCLVWFMNAAMKNERLAARQKLADSYRAQLSSIQMQLERHWEEKLDELEKLARTTSPAAAFARCIQSGFSDSVLIANEQGDIVYPNSPSPVAAGEAGPKWAEANHSEYVQKDFGAAASLYRALARDATNTHLAARALQAEARCLVSAGRKEEAIRLVKDMFAQERYCNAADPQGRLIAANAELMALELGADDVIAQRLKQRLMDYDNRVLAAPQRRFLMKELRRLRPDMEFPTLAAEELAAQSLPTNLWKFTTANRRVVALMRFDKLQSHLRTVTDAPVSLAPPGTEHDAAFVSVPAGARLAGARLIIPLGHPIEQPTHIYLWTGMLVLAAMGVLTLFAIRLLRRQAALARMKNDLAATVSHELKTPLSSIRVLVDTLLDAEKLDEGTAREYLQLIARENERLSRLIQHFLTFSRMERNKQAFHVMPLAVRPIIDIAVEAMPGGRLELQVPSDLPRVMADADAVATALINLLDNACKYSETGRHVVLRAEARNGSVLFSVQDHGIGIAARETKKIFDPFYQVDQRLSRKGGGCGLGLSIVQSIVRAHDGCVSVESEPGRGSTFTITLPTAKESADA